MQFCNIKGHEELKEQLIATVGNNRISHAQLFIGPEGSGSLALAIAYAQYIACENKAEKDSCGICASCQKFNKLIHPDLHFSYPFIASGKDSKASDFIVSWRQLFAEGPYFGLNNWLELLNAENKQANINISECHDIIQKMAYKPFESEFKVVIMWLPEFLKEEGNVLLKIIEEPAHKTLFLFVAEQEDQLLSTIRSRMQLVKVPKLTDEEVTSYLVENHSVDQAKAERLAYLANGNMSQAIELINHEVNDFGELFSNWMRLCYTNDGLKIVDICEEITKLGREAQKGFLKYSVHLLRECLLLSFNASALVRLNGAELDFAKKFSTVIHQNNAYSIIEELEKAHYHVERNANAKILFLALSLRLSRLLRAKS